MKSQAPSSPSTSPSTRRDFLKKSGTASVALAGALSVSNTFASGQNNEASGTETCNYSLLPDNFVYLNSGTEGSMPDCVTENFRAGLQKWASNPTTSYETDPVFGKRQQLNREVVGQFFGVSTDNICLTDNTTMGMSMTLMGLNFQAGDRAIMTNHEHNAIKSPLAVQQARVGLKVITRAFAPAAELHGMNTDELLDRLFPDIPSLRGAKALCVSHVYPSTGVRLPLQALRRRADQLGIRYLVVDGAQAMGMLNLGPGPDSLQHSDFYAGPGHKWFNGPPGTGVLYLKNAGIQPPEFYPTLSQRMGEYSEANSPFPMAQALQVRGCSNVPGFAAMIRAMQFQQESGGPVATEKHILALSANIKDTIRKRSPSALVSPHADPALRSGLSVFFPFNWDRPHKLFTDKKRADWVVSELLKRKIQIRSIGFDNSGSSKSAARPVYALRVSTAAFNTSEQSALFLRALEEVLGKIA